ncbi:MAG: polysaccharide deacetylase family protein [Planctomycetes bacterium]|nr:polysaccharide deacetylase family protein [Planctomycetota bacterium]
MRSKGILIISLDFELYWGVHDKISLDDYIKKYPKSRSIVSALLDLFNKYQTHSTWSTVGFLFFKTRAELLGGLPSEKPDYSNKSRSPYEFVSAIGNDEAEAPFCYAPSLIKLVLDTPHQEVGTHTCSHYYCLEEGQNINAFRSDLESAIRVAKKYNLTPESLVFPRNQFNPACLDICREMGIKSYRGNELSYLYKARNEDMQSLFYKGLRFLDGYFNISGHNCYSVDSIERKLPFNFPSSRLFFRPVNARLKMLEPLRLRRILSGLRYAAQRGLVYHLWMHPHSLELNLRTNLLFIEKILKYYLIMRERYGMENLTMSELSHLLLEI